MKLKYQLNDFQEELTKQIKDHIEKTRIFDNEVEA